MKITTFFRSTATFTCSLTTTGLLLSMFLACSQSGDDTGGKQKFANGLINETSPYLLQHAHNPVNWQPWGDQTLQMAQDANKLLVISIGYSSCHWCHVMEKESFSDTAVADLMNNNYVSVKVDREERPDVDQVYMDAAQLLNGRGGWPLNVIALPDGRPVYAGTYFPRDNWMQVLEFFIKEYENNPDKLVNQAEQLTNGLSTINLVTLNNQDKKFDSKTYADLFQQTILNLDLRKGGRKGAPKFPTPIVFQSLLEMHYHLEKESALDAVLVTLDRVANGGIYDHLGGGFARYSTDADWKVPHFEKMLYDNAQLVGLYSQAYRKIKKDLYKTVVIETIGFLNRELRDETGGYYSSLDADSEGEEGKFYTWEKSEIDKILGQDAALFSELYYVTREGNWEDKRNILFTSDKNREKVFDKSGLNQNDFVRTINESRNDLLKAREKRIRPSLDDKILTSWNGLMISGLVEAYFAFNDNDYLENALDAGNFILDNQLREDGGLNRNFKDGRSTINGFLDDYAFVIEAFLKLYQVTFDEKWLKSADRLMDYTKRNFLNENSLMFYYTSAEDDPLIVRKTDLHDNVLPSSNSTMANALLQLGHYFYRPDYIDQASQMLTNMLPHIQENPYYYTNWLRLYARLTYPFYEVAIVGDESKNKRNELLADYFPNSLILGGNDEGSLALLENKLVSNRTMIYVCENKVCRLPVTEVAQAKPMIRKK